MSTYELCRLWSTDSSWHLYTTDTVLTDLTVDLGGERCMPSLLSTNEWMKGERKYPDADVTEISSKTFLANHSEFHKEGNPTKLRYRRKHQFLR